MDTEQRVSPIETSKDGQSVPDITPKQAEIASAKIAIENAEKARASLEQAANESKTPTERQQEIDDILKKLK